MSSKLAFPQFAQLEQNLQISYHALDSCESTARYKMPAYSVVKDPCAWIVQTASLPVRPPLAFVLKGCGTIKNPASSAGPSRPDIPGRVRAMLD